MSNAVVQHVDVDLNDVFDPDLILANHGSFVVPPYPGQEVLARDHSLDIQFLTTVVEVDEEGGVVQLALPTELPVSARHPGAGGWNVAVSDSKTRSGDDADFRVIQGFSWNPARTIST